MNRMNVSCLRLQSYDGFHHHPNIFGRKGETYSDKAMYMRQTRGWDAISVAYTQRACPSVCQKVEISKGL